MDHPAGGIEVLVGGPEEDGDSRALVEAQAAEAPFPIRYVSAPSSRRSVCLNAAVAAADGEVLAFVDDDGFAERDWLTALAGPMREEAAVGIVGGVDVLAGATGTFDLAFDAILNSTLATGGCRRPANAQIGDYYPRLWNMAMPAALARIVVAAREDEGDRPGLFDESLHLHEDVELGNRVRRMGKRLVFLPAARVNHQRETKLGVTLRRDFDMARASRSLGVHRRPHRLLVAALLTSLALVGLGFLQPVCWLILAAAMGAHFLLGLLVGIQGLLRTRRLGVLLLVPLLLAALHLARATGYLVGRGRSLDQP
jgi:GT2 family glycosyltransferase